MPYMTLIMLIVFVGLQYKLWFGDGSVHDLRVLQKKADEQTAINQQLDEKNASLVADIKELKNGDQALEEQARQTLGMVKEDETYYQVIEPSKHRNHHDSTTN